ncbi:hypothetical protein BGZ58_007693 [Dissophora ornata]|nr:hypothetical protein BGZ58_007693 [Dissophora ornata]
MPAGGLDATVAGQHQYISIEVVIEVLKDHRQYTSQLVPDLRDLLSSLQTPVAPQKLAASSSGRQPIPTPLKTNYAQDVNSANVGKHVKRLFNQSLSMLNKWSEVVQQPDASDVVAQETTAAMPNRSQAGTITTISRTTMAAGKITATTSTAATTARSRSVSISKSAKAMTTSKTATTVTKSHSTSLPEDTSQGQQKRVVGLMRGAKTNSSQGATINSDSRSSRTTIAARLTVPAPVKSELSTLTAVMMPTAAPTLSGAAANKKFNNQNAIYDTDRPTYAHINVLVDVGFLAVRALELMSSSIPTTLFEIEKARSNLISKVIHLGMKKRALQELGFLREQLIRCAASLWNEPDLEAKDEQDQLRLKTSECCSFPNSSLMSFAAAAATDPIKKTYQSLFTFPFPVALSRLTAGTSPSTTMTTVGDSRELDQALTFIRLVQALHNNALRCWMDVRSGSLAYLLPEMMSHRNSPYDWCMCIAKAHRQAGQQSLDALFRLLFIGAGKAVDNNPTPEGHRHAFMLRMHGIRYYGACKHITEAKDGMVWDKVLRCGVEFEKSIRDAQTQEDILILLHTYKTAYDFLKELSAVDLSDARFQEWFKHLEFFVRKMDVKEMNLFLQSIQSGDRDLDMTEATEAARSGASQSVAGLSRHLTSPIATSQTKLKPAPFAQPSTAPTTVPVLGRLENAVKALRRFEDLLQGWHSMTQPGQDLETCALNTKRELLSLEEGLSSFPMEGLTTATLQNAARIFRSVDTIRSIGSKILDKCEKGQNTDSARPSTVPRVTDMLERWLSSTKAITQILSNVTAGLWHQIQTDYIACHDANGKAVPDPIKLSCARVDAILFLFRLHQSSHDSTTSLEQRPILEYLESAFLIARQMNDSESLPWISNALYNLGGTLFKVGKRQEAIRPLEAAIDCYRVWLGDALLVDTSLEDMSVQSGEVKDSKVEARLVLANRYEVLGVCLQAINDLNRALDCFNSGLCALPLDAFRSLDTVAQGDLKISQLPAAKLLNRRTRILLMLEGSQFMSIVISVPEFDSKMTRRGVPNHFRGVVQEFECGLLSVLSVKAYQANRRNQERIEILKYLMNKVYRGGRLLANPIRRARVLVQLAVLYQSNGDIELQQEALHLVEEAIEILKERELMADLELEPVRNHNLAMAYSWYGILDRNRSNGLSRKSKPFQIALQLWEMMLSNVECFVSCEDTALLDHRANVERVLKQLPEPELLYDHLQMLADCLGMNDYRVLQVQIYLLMLRLINGVLTVSDDTCADAVRIYARIGQAYLALGYSGKAKMALNHGKLILEEMARASNESTLRGEVYAIWLLVYSLYLTSVGHKAQGVSAYNQAKHQSEKHQALIGAGDGVAGSLPKPGALSRKVEAKVQRALILVEASLARSQLLYYEGNLSEAIMDSRRAGRQLSRIISTLSVAIKAAQKDDSVIVKQPMKNPFLVQQDEENEEPEGSRRNHVQEQVSVESRQLQQGLEMLATQRYQWPIFKLLIEAYRQLGKLYLVQGSVREAQYFVKEGKVIAQLSKAGKSMDSFMLDEAEMSLHRHEWEDCQQILQDLIMQEDGSNAGALSWEIQDARIQLLNGDFYYATAQWELSIQAYYSTEEVLSHLMDKSFISELEQLIIREPQTPREAKLVKIEPHQRPSIWSIRNMQSETSMAFHGPSTPDQAQFECVTLGGIKAALGYRTSLIFGEEGHLMKAHQLIERSRAEDPMGFTVAEYHFTKAKLLILELEVAMAKHLMYAMIPDSALSVGLFKKTQTQQLAPLPALFREHSNLEDNEEIDPLLNPASVSIMSSPSVRVTRVTRRRRSQLAHEAALQSPSTRTRRGATTAKKIHQDPGKTLIDNYHRILMEAREHLSSAYKHSIRTYSPHVVSNICSKQAYLSVLESCFQLEESHNNELGFERTKGDDLWAMANRAACYLEMAKAVTQHREMHGLIKQKLNPESAHEDQAWPRDIQLKQHGQSGPRQISQAPLQQQVLRIQKGGAKTINYIGLEKPRRLQLTANMDNEQESESGTDHLVGYDDDDDDDADDVELNEVGMDSESLKSRRGKREYFDRQSRLHASSALGNEREFLKILDDVYKRDTLIMEDQPDTFQRDFVDIIPEKWTVVSLSMDVENEVLYVNRLRANAMPLVVRLPLNRAQSREGDDKDLGLDLAYGLGFDYEQNSAELGPPLSYKDALEELQDILRESQDTLAMTSSKNHADATGASSFASKPADLPRQVKAEWWARRQRLDDRLCVLLGAMEDQWLCGLRGLIQSHNTPANDDNLLGFKKTLEWIMSQAVNTMSSAPSSVLGGRASASSKRQSFIQIEINIDLCRTILHLGDQPTFQELKDLIYFLVDAYLYKNTTSACASPSATSGAGSDVETASSMIDYTVVQFGRIAMQIKEALRCYWVAETEAKNNGFDDGAHVILILDKHLQVFPWESCPVLRGEAVSRVPSLWFLRDRIMKQRYLISRSNQRPARPLGMDYTDASETEAEAGYPWNSGEWKDLEVNPKRAFYVLNPGGDLKNTEDEFREYVESQEGWDGIVGRAPLEMECINGLLKNDLYVYFGHSGGEQYIKSTQIRQLGHCAVSLLLGCSSGSLKGGGEFDPTGNAMNYLLAGCPTLVANLWDVTDKDLDRFSMATFNLWGLQENRCDRSNNRGQGSHNRDLSLKDGGASAMEGIQEERKKGETKKTSSGLRLSLVEAVKEAREECKLKFLVGAASVVYGIPCFLKRGNSSDSQKP